MRYVPIINYLLLAGLLAFAVLVWPELPERIPRHFDGSGEADAWSETTLFAWFLMPAMAAFTLLLLHLSVWATWRWPQLLNMPSKQQFLELSRAEQEPILQLCADCIHLLGTMILLIFAAVQYATYSAAQGEPTRSLMLGVLMLALVGTPAIALVLIARTSAMVNDAHRRSRLRGTLAD